MSLNIIYPTILLSYAWVWAPRFTYTSERYDLATMLIRALKEHQHTVMEPEMKSCCHG
jgi:hypothetical protein